MAQVWIIQARACFTVGSTFKPGVFLILGVAAINSNEVIWRPTAVDNGIVQETQRLIVSGLSCLLHAAAWGLLQISPKADTSNYIAIWYLLNLLYDTVQMYMISSSTHL